MWCYTLPLRLMLKKIFYTVILCAYDKPTWQEKAVYTFKLILTFAPIAFLLDSFNLWYKDNSQFFSFIICALLINMGVGVMFHIKMWVVLIVTYALLEMLRLTAGNNLVGEGFKVMIQITTLLYPVSKALKNIYIWSEKQFPPQFIMDKIYNFEKTGDIKELFDNDKNEEK